MKFVDLEKALTIMDNLYKELDIITQTDASASAKVAILQIRTAIQKIPTLEIDNGVFKNYFNELNNDDSKGFKPNTNLDLDDDKVAENIGMILCNQQACCALCPACGDICDGYPNPEVYQAFARHLLKNIDSNS